MVIVTRGVRGGWLDSPPIVAVDNTRIVGIGSNTMLTLVEAASAAYGGHPGGPEYPDDFEIVPNPRIWSHRFNFSVPEFTWPEIDVDSEKDFMEIEREEFKVEYLGEGCPCGYKVGRNGVGCIPYHRDERKQNRYKCNQCGDARACEALGR